MPIITTLGSAAARGFNPYSSSPILAFHTRRYGTAVSDVTWSSTEWPVYIYATFVPYSVTAATVNGVSMSVSSPAQDFGGWCYGGSDGIYTVVLTLSGGGTLTQYFFATYNVLAPDPNATSNLSGTYVVPAGVTQIYLEGSGSGGGGGSGAGPGENYILVGGGGGGGQAFRGTINVTAGETITYSVARQGYAARWYSYDFGGFNVAPIGQYTDGGNNGKSGWPGQATTVSTSSGSLTLSASGGAAGAWASGGAGGSSGTKSGTEAANITFNNGASGSGSRPGGAAGGYGVSGYIASGDGGAAANGNYYDPVIYGTTPYFSYSANMLPGMRGGAATSESGAFTGFGGGGSGGYGNTEFGTGNGCGGPGAPGYLIIKPVG